MSGYTHKQLRANRSHDTLMIINSIAFDYNLGVWVWQNIAHSNPFELESLTPTEIVSAMACGFEVSNG